MSYIVIKNNSKSIEQYIFMRFLFIALRKKTPIKPAQSILHRKLKCYKNKNLPKNNQFPSKLLI